MHLTSLSTYSSAWHRKCSNICQILKLTFLINTMYKIFKRKGYYTLVFLKEK